MPGYLPPSMQTCFNGGYRPPSRDPENETSPAAPSSQTPAGLSLAGFAILVSATGTVAVGGGTRISAKPTADAQSCSTLFDCLYAEKPDRALELLKGGPQVDRADGRREEDRSARCRLSKYAKVVKWLVEHKADVNALGENDYTPLHYADRADIVELLLKGKPRLNLVSATGQTPLQLAAAELVQAQTKDVVQPAIDREAAAQSWSEVPHRDRGVSQRHDTVESDSESKSEPAHNLDGFSPL